MNKLYIGTLLALSFFAYNETANAACVGTPITWGDISGNPVVKADSKTDGSPCTFRFFTNSGTWESGTIIKKPNNGDLVYVNVYTFEYTPKKGFKGKDNFTFKICGSERTGSKGCVTMERDVVVE